MAFLKRWGNRGSLIRRVLRLDFIELPAGQEYISHACGVEEVADSLG